MVLATCFDYFLIKLVSDAVQMKLHSAGSSLSVYARMLLIFATLQKKKKFSTWHSLHN